MEFDYVVVGAGAAGSAVAGRLAASAKKPSVLLVEYGGPARNPLLHVPKGFYYTLRGDRYLYRYETRPVTPQGQPEVWLRGKVLGGSAAVNGMMWLRGAPADWDGLARTGNPGWAWADVRPAYQAVEDQLGVSVTDTKDEVTRAIIQAATGYGLEHVQDVNASDAERIGYTPSSIRHGRRTTSYDAFVRPALASKSTKITVATRARAAALTFDGTRVTGISTVDSSGITRTVGARREVIVCAGAVETPLLLERSGIGHPDLLRQHGIELKAASPNVGEGLIEQRGAALQVTLNRDANRLTTPAGRIAETFRYLVTRHGLLATGGYDLVCQFKSSPAAARPDVQGLFVPMALDTTSKDLKLARHAGILFMGYPIRPETTSSVHVSGPGPDDPPVIDPHFLETRADQDAVAPVLGIVRRLLGEPPVAALIAGEEFPGPGVAPGAETVEYSKATGTGIYHAVGSAAMGPADEDVVDASLRVRGVSGLRIADISVLPSQVSGNAAAPATLIGYRAADLILSDG